MLLCSRNIQFDANDHCVQNNMALCCFRKMLLCILAVELPDAHSSLFVLHKVQSFQGQAPGMLCDCCFVANSGDLSLLYCAGAYAAALLPETIIVSCERTTCLMLIRRVFFVNCSIMFFTCRSLAWPAVWRFAGKFSAFWR